jgi:hypothetical protein
MMISAGCILVALPAAGLETKLSDGTETLIVNWPEPESGKWSQLYKEEEELQAYIKVAHYNEIGKLFETGMIKARFRMPDADLTEHAKHIYQSMKRLDPRARFRFNKDRLDGTYDNRIFMIRTKDIQGNKESQVWLILKGKESVFEIQRSLKQSRIDRKKLAEIADFFKKVRIVPDSESE